MLKIGTQYLQYILQSAKKARKKIAVFFAKISAKTNKKDP